MSEETPRKVYWAGRQWCVTDYGLETIREHEYYVEAARLADRTDGDDPAKPPQIETIRHIAEKNWVDIEDLFAAYVIAAHVHGVTVPEGSLLRTMRHARAALWEAETFSRMRAQERAAAGNDSRFDVVSFSDMVRLGDRSSEALADHLAAGADFRFIDDPQHDPAYVEANRLS
jgi:hypothetical protein